MKILYLSEKHIPDNAFFLTKEHFLNIENLKKESNYYWCGTLDSLISAVSEYGTENAIKVLNILLEGVVKEIENDVYYTCNAVVMHCCAGAYLRIVNKKEYKSPDFSL